MLAFNLAVVTMAAAVVADVETTVRCLRLGKGQESNPIAAWIMRHFGTGRLPLYLFQAWIMLGLVIGVLKMHPALPWLVPVMGTVAHAGAALWNRHVYALLAGSGK